MRESENEIGFEKKLDLDLGFGFWDFGLWNLGF